MHRQEMQKTKHVTFIMEGISCLKHFSKNDDAFMHFLAKTTVIK